MQIKPNIYNVGVNGNNAYLITGEKTALIDTVSKESADALVKNIEEIIPINKIDYLILNHTEQDKSGAVKAILEKNPDIEIIATVAGLRNLKEMLNSSFNGKVAKDSAVRDLGSGLTLNFIITPNINWPDSMITYEEKNKTLFSCDLFSDNQEPSLYPDFLQNAIERIRKLETEIICTGHGGVRKTEIIDEYKEDGGQNRDKKIYILYSSRYGTTREMADTIHNTLKEQQLYAVCVDAELDFDEKDCLLTQEFDAFIVGTQTENNGANKAVLEKIISLNPVRLRHKPFFTFGSYGWSGEGPQIVHNLLKSYGMKPFSKPFMSIFDMSEDKRAELIKHTQKFAEYIYKEN